MELLLERRALREIEGEAARSYPNECCGLLIGAVPEDFGREDCRLEVARLHALANAWEGEARARRYTVDAAELARVERSFDGSGQGIIGVYHSHPDVPAWPSPFDLERAWPCYAYLIVSVRGGRSCGSRVWRLNAAADSFAEGALLSQ